VERAARGERQFGWRQFERRSRRAAVSGASAAAKLDAASIVAKNRSFFKGIAPGFFCTDTVQSIGAY
jgi:hypothetical protein